MNTLTSQKMQFESHPYQRRIGSVPMSIALIAGWLLVGLELVLSIVALQYDLPFGILSLLALCLFASYMIFVTYQWTQDSQHKVVLVIDKDRINLLTVDKRQHITAERKMSLTDVLAADYFAAPETSTIFLNGKSTHMVIPLWKFGQIAEQKIVGFIEFSGITVTRFPASIVI